MERPSLIDEQAVVITATSDGGPSGASPGHEDPAQTGRLTAFPGGPTIGRARGHFSTTLRHVIRVVVAAHTASLPVNVFARVPVPVAVGPMAGGNDSRHALHDQAIQ
jgi:hypothetical protein